MINLGMFFNRTLNVGNIFFTGHEREEATFATVVTENPVEYGANVTDHAYIKPIVLKVRPFVSELPAYSLSPEGIFNAFKDTSDALDVVYQLMVKRQVIDVKCNIGFFPGMMITEMTPMSDLENLTTIPIELTLQQIIFDGDPSYQDPFESQYKNMVNRGALQLLEELEELVI